MFLPTNRLANEQSPYLLQHAHNPVDWYPWGEEAFKTARELDRPIFLSIGYATCHWCHVMEHESFEDESVARLMNEAFVNVKVDREERPDIDGIYMAVAQMATGQGGWPLTIVMTPDRRPFFSGTYFPRDSRFGRPGMLDLVPRIRELWETRRDELLTAADETLERLQALARADQGGHSLDRETLSRGLEELKLEFDPERGGFGRAPKFPTPHRMLFLLRYWRRTGVDQALDMVVQTLDALRAGGIFDQVGYGFHRYSTDQRWLLPHFEKMLYDQALLVMAYVEAFQATGDARHARVANEVLKYVLRDLTAPEGGFYSAEDADSEGEEGKFYVWTEDELRQVLGESDADIAARAWSIRPEGNFVDEATGERPGTNIPHLVEPLRARAEELGLTEAELERGLASISGAPARAPEPAGSSPAGRQDPHRLERADDRRISRKRAERCESPSTWPPPRGRPASCGLRCRADGDLLHRYRGGDADIPANLDDYAFLAWAEIELHQATQDPEHLRRAIVLTEAMLERFRDEESGGPVLQPRESPRPHRSAAGGVRRCGSVGEFGRSVELVEARAAHGRGRGTNDSRANFHARSPAPSAAIHRRSPCSCAVSRSWPTVGRNSLSRETRNRMPCWQCCESLGRGYEPHLVTIVRPAGANPGAVAETAPFLVDFTGEPGAEATAYLCRGLMCERPVTTAAELELSLLARRRLPDQTSVSERP